MLESAILMPLVFLTLIILINLILNLFLMVNFKTSADECVRKAACIIGKTTGSFMDADQLIDKVSIKRTQGAWYSNVLLSQNDIFHGNQFNDVDVKKLDFTQSSIVDEDRFIRNVDLLIDAAYSGFEEIYAGGEQTEPVKNE